MVKKEEESEDWPFSLAIDQLGYASMTQLFHPNSFTLIMYHMGINDGTTRNRMMEMQHNLGKCSNGSHMLHDHGVTPWKDVNHSVKQSSFGG